MPIRESSLDSAVFYNGERYRFVQRPSRGSASEVEIPDDLGSAVVQEVTEQMNESRVNERNNLAVANGATGRIPLLSAPVDLMVEDITILNGQTNPLANANTDIKVAVAAAGDVDMQGGPTSPLPTANGLFFAEGFGANNLAGQTEHPLSTFGATKTDALTKAFDGPFVLYAGQVLYAETVNNEGAAINLGFRTDYAIFDRIKLQPGDLAREVVVPNRRFHRTVGREN